jgi:dihydrofolate reductase
MEVGVINPIRLHMSMSLDGYIAGPDDRPGQELGRDGGRLFNWLDDRKSDGPSRQVYRKGLATCTVISGRRTFEALLRAGQIDETEIHLVQVLLGSGRRLFDHLGHDHIELGLVRRLDDRDVTHFRYRVRRPEEAA